MSYEVAEELFREYRIVPTDDPFRRTGTDGVITITHLDSVDRTIVSSDDGRITVGPQQNGQIPFTFIKGVETKTGGKVAEVREGTAASVRELTDIIATLLG